jgi:hypothetical protein
LNVQAPVVARRSMTSKRLPPFDRQPWCGDLSPLSLYYALKVQPSSQQHRYDQHRASSIEHPVSSIRIRQAKTVITTTPHTCYHRPTMLKPRAIIFIIVVTVLIYFISPASRKKKIVEKIKLIWTALVISLVIFWIFMLGGKVIEWWK